VLGAGACDHKTASYERPWGLGTPPATPHIVAPLNAAYSGSVRMNDGASRRPLFAWDFVKSERPVSYALELTSSCIAGRLDMCSFDDAVVQVHDLSATQWRPSKPLPVNDKPPLGRRYYWRLRACAELSCSPWTSVRYLEVGRAPGDFNGDGYSDVVVGAPLVDNGGQDQGSVFVYYGGPAGVGKSVRLDDPDHENSANFGVSVSVVGDLDADGFADLIVGAAGSNDARGAAYLYFGSETGLHDFRKTKLADVDGTNDDWFGSAVSSAGDVNGDGFADVLVGASGANRDGADWGVAYLYTGGPMGAVSDEPIVLHAPAQDYDQFGSAVTSAGDVNGDGYADIAIGCPGTDLVGRTRGKDRGAVYVFAGSARGPRRVPTIRLVAPVPIDYDRFGASISGGGDVNRDGYSDLIVGAPGADKADMDTGAAYVFLGSDHGLNAVPSNVLDDPDATIHDRFGTAVTIIGDIDGDDYADMAVGSAGEARGRALIFRGSPEGIGSSHPLTLNDPLGPGYNDFAESISAAGDVNGDGLRDIIIGASGSDNGGIFRGSVVLYPGAPEGLRRRMPLRIDDPAHGTHDHFGHVVAGGNQ